MPTPWHWGRERMTQCSPSMCCTWSATWMQRLRCWRGPCARGGLLISKTPCLAEMNPLIPHVAVPLMRALGMAPPVLCISEQRLQSALVQQGFQIVCAERHGTRGKDIRAFVVARKPG